ncbi:MAG: hypothetical protein Q9172_002749 [Xanthocarpia lactea]
MIHYQGATFEIVSNNVPCPTYDEPDVDPPDEQNGIISLTPKYIEALTGAKFAVFVTLDPDFPFGDCDAVRVRVNYDDSRAYYKDIKRKDALGGSRLQRSTGFTAISTYCPVTGQWQIGDLTFGELTIKESCDSKISLGEIQHLGKIEITYQRIRYGKSYEYTPPVRDGYISEVSEKMLKGKSIQHSIRFCCTLEMLGCIPETLTPKSHSRRTGEKEATSTDTDPAIKDELQALRARLAQLEKQAGSAPQPNIKAEQARSIPNLKRERQDKENDVQQKRSRKSGPTEVVDLTVD